MLLEWFESQTKCSWLEIFDQQGNLNLIPLVVDSLSYHLVSELQAQDRIYVSFAFLFNLFFIVLVFNRSKIIKKNPIWALLKNLRGENESFICVNECKQSGLKFLEHILLRECCEVLCIFISYFCSKVTQIDSRTNPLEEVENDMNRETSIIQYTSMKMWRKCCQNYQKDVSIHATLKKNEVWLL